VSSPGDQRTADAFATSWNNLPEGSVYTAAQFAEWLTPLTREDITGKRVLELGCGGGSLLVHMASWHPSELIGVDLGSSVETAERNLKAIGADGVQVLRHDLVDYTGEHASDVVYCIGVLHHLQQPKLGFDAVVRNTKPSGRFHCWVYAYEGNTIIRWIVDPIRRLASRLPWWLTKYALATPLVVPFYLYAKTLNTLRWPVMHRLPLYEYSIWIAQRDFSFFRHVAFDQLVTPRTIYLRRETIDNWLQSDARIDPDSTYVTFRNGNSWKFGGRTR
jgi:SAM-dependent methyltransferase